MDRIVSSIKTSDFRSISNDIIWKRPNAIILFYNNIKLNSWKLNRKYSGRIVSSIKTCDVVYEITQTLSNEDVSGYLMRLQIVIIKVR